MAASPTAQNKKALIKYPLKNYLILAIIIAGIALLWFLLNTKKQVQMPAVVVQVAKVENRDVPRYLTAIGTVQSPHAVTITPQIDGELKTVHFREGENVKRGQLLAEIDDRKIRASLEQARAEKRRNEALLKTATLTLQRYKNLLKDDAVTPQTVDQQAAEVAQLQATIASAEAAIETASVQLDYTKIKSPIDGRTGMRRIDAGNIVRPNDTSALLTITQLQPIDVLFSLPQDDLPKLQKLIAGDNASANDQTTKNIIGSVETRLRDGSEILDQGRLQTLDNQIDPATGSVQLKARFSNEKQNLWPGQFVVVRLCVDVFHNATVIPIRALLRGRESTFVYRIKDGQADAVNVKVLFEDDRIAVIESSLGKNDSIVTDGQLKLKPGLSVKIANQEKSQKDNQTSDPIPDESKKTGRQ
jgi:RND family efflux transporter MFP subunit